MLSFSLSTDSSRWFFPYSFSIVAVQHSVWRCKNVNDRWQRPIVFTFTLYTTMLPFQNQTMKNIVSDDKHFSYLMFSSPSTFAFPVRCLSFTSLSSSMAIFPFYNSKIQPELSMCTKPMLVFMNRICFVRCFFFFSFFIISGKQPDEWVHDVCCAIWYIVK